MSRNFKLLSMLVIVLLLLSACTPGPGAMRGGGWMWGVAGEEMSKATFGFTGASKMVDDCLETKGQFTYNDRSVEGIKFHGEVTFAGAEEEWGVLKGTFEDDGDMYWFKARAKDYGNKEIGLEMKVWRPGFYYFNDGMLEGGNIKFWPED